MAKDKFFKRLLRHALEKKALEECQASLRHAIAKFQVHPIYVFLLARSHILSDNSSVCGNEFVSER
jgi:hypothetical protein